MKHILLFTWMVVLIFATSCSSAKEKGDDSLVSIRTAYGDIKVRLYDKTPEHKKNFLKLVGEGFYEDLLFHRVIENFMIQGGDPESKGAEPGKRLGGGSLDYTLPAEFVSEYFHKRGALAAARRGGSSNPEKRSSASQFYIVQGELFSAGKLDTLEMMKNSQTKNEIVRQELEEAREELDEFRRNNNQEGFNMKVAAIREKADSLMMACELFFEFSEEQREIYTTIGGYPSLDGDYTVFGEVVEGMAVVDSIASKETDQYNRPLEDVTMKIEMGD